MKINDYSKKLYESCGGDSSYSSSCGGLPTIPKPKTRRDKILMIRKSTGMDSEDAEKLMDEYNDDYEKIIKLHKKEKKPKEKKVFKVGDKIVCIDNKPSKNMPSECIDFLLTYKFFKVLDVNDKYNIDVGYRLAENGNIYWFAPNRFELKDGKAPTIVIEPDKKEEGENPSKSFELFPGQNKKIEEIRKKEEEKRKYLEDMMKKQKSSKRTDYDYNPWDTTSGGGDWA